jgi:hypothetical protein
MQSLDLTCRKVLMSAYLYYKRDFPVLSDAENDSLIQTLINNWNDIPERYLPLLDPLGLGSDSIAATTCHCKYTRLVEGGALAWLKDKQGVELERLNEGYTELKPKLDLSKLF